MSNSLARFIPAIFAFGGVLTSFAGEPQKWSDVPEAVRKTILANGGAEGNAVDKESEQVDGKVLYEAPVKDKDGNVLDLQITADGKLVETKTDDAADAAQERIDRGLEILKTAKFSRPRQIDNAWLPLAKLNQDVLEGKEGNTKIRIERTAKPDVRKTYKIGDQMVEAFCVEDREFTDGKLAEVALDYFAQADDGSVFYLGEDVDEYKDDKIVGHSGTWHFGKDTQTPGILFPGAPKVGVKFMSEDVSKDIHEHDEIVALNETVKTPAGTYANCIKLKEVLADGEIEFKYFAQGIGVVREVPAGGDVLLISHRGAAEQQGKSAK